MEYVTALVIPVAVILGWAGTKALIISASGPLTLPALATKIRALFGSPAAWVGLIPRLATPMLLSPETSICSAVPGLVDTFVLIPKTAWKFAGFGGLFW